MPLNSAIEQLNALRNGELTSTDLVERAIEQIQKSDKAINAVIVRDFDRARRAARAADQARKAGSDQALLGLPLTVKEAFDVAALPTTWGLPGNHEPAAEDSVLVQRLRTAGAIILGKTNVATMLADWQTMNELFGVTNNPWDITRTSGGSSGGGAAAVAAGMTPLEFGSDLAGSLRIPAAFCGVFAHRPSHGIVPMRGFAPPMAPRTPIAQSIDQSTVGPMARTVDDLKLALDVVAGADIPDATAWRLSLPPPRHTALKEFRVLFLDEHPQVMTSEAIRKEIGKMARQLEKQGCKVGYDNNQVPDMKDLTRTFSALLTAFMSVDSPEDEKPGTTMSYRDWMLLDRHRLALAAQWRDTFERWDVVLCPVAPRTAFPHDERPFDKRKLEVDGSHINYDKMSFWTSLGTPVGLPVTTVPIGRDGEGLPIGMQIIGPRLEDNTPLSFAGLLERELGCGFQSPSARAHT
jgi:amidase